MELGSSIIKCMDWLDIDPESVAIELVTKQSVGHCDIVTLCGHTMTFNCKCKYLFHIIRRDVVTIDNHT